MFWVRGTGVPAKVMVNAHCKLRQLSEMVQSPEVPSGDKVCVLRLLRESHIWDRVTLGGQVGGSDVGDGKGNSEAERDDETEGKGEADEGEGEEESEGEGEADERESEYKEDDGGKTVEASEESGIKLSSPSSIVHCYIQLL